MSGHKQSGLRPFARRAHACVYACVNRWRWAQRVCVWNKRWRVWGGFLPASLSLPPSRSLARSLPCVTSESEACWLDLHLIQLVSSISATPKNSRLFSRLHRHLIPGKATPRAADTYTHTHTHTLARKHRRARAPDTSGSRCNDKARQGKGVGADVNSISKTKQHKKKNTRGAERGRRGEPGTKLMAHNAVGIVTKWICRPIVCNKRPNWSRGLLSLVCCSFWHVKYAVRYADSHSDWII